MGNIVSPTGGVVFPFLHSQRRTTMSTNTTTHAVCRLLGGSGRAQLTAVPVQKIPALLAPSKPLQAGMCTLPFSLPLAA
jgi:hypothetical protein